MVTGQEKKNFQPLFVCFTFTSYHVILKEVQEEGGQGQQGSVDLLAIKLLRTTIITWFKASAHAPYTRLTENYVLSVESKDREQSTC